MARKPEFNFTSVGGRWKVEVPARYSPSGKRERAFFPTRDKAKAYASEMKEKIAAHGILASNIKPSLADDATLAAKMLEPYGLTLLEAVKRVVEVEKAKAASKEVAAALTAFLVSKESRSDSQRRAYEQMQASMEFAFGGRTLSSITPTELLEHVENSTGSDSTFNSRATSIKTFWRWCSKLPRNWCDVKTTEVLERREIRKSSIGVLTGDQCEALMRAAEAH